MNTLKLYNGFFNNVGANPLDSLLTEVIQYILDSQSSVLSNYVNIIGSNIGCNGVNKLSAEILNKYLYIDSKTYKIRLQNCKAMDITIYPNKDNVKKIPDMFYFDQSDNISLTFTAENMSQSDFDIFKGRLPKTIFKLYTVNCNIDSWDWLEGVETVNDIALTNGTLSRGISAKVFKHKCESITLDNVTFDVDNISLPEFINPSEIQSEIRIINCTDVKKIDLFDKHVSKVSSLCIYNTFLDPSTKLESIEGLYNIDELNSLYVSYDVLRVLVSIPQDQLPKRIKYIEINKYPNTPEANEIVNKIQSMFVRAKITKIKTKR